MNLSFQMQRLIGISRGKVFASIIIEYSALMSLGILIGAATRELIYTGIQDKSAREKKLC